MASIEEDLKVLEGKLNALKLDYERYFLGTRPREPVQLRAEVQKIIVLYSNQAIQNTALRFKFSSICSRYQAYKRRWEETLRQMEDGTYVRHRFRAGLRRRDAAPPPPSGGDPGDGDDLYAEYRKARQSCGQDVKNLTPDRLDAILERERAALRKRFGKEDFQFRVVVEDGKAKLKARRIRNSA